VFVNTGFQQPSPEFWAVRPTGRGDVTESHVVWKIKERVPIESSPIIKNGLIYMVNDQGKLSCIDAKTGRFIWQEKLKGQFGSSPVYADGRIYFSNKKGERIYGITCDQGRFIHSAYEDTSVQSGRVVTCPEIPVQLFNLRNDSSEKYNLAKHEKAITQKLSQKDIAWRKSMPVKIVVN
jgi:hypothetical protein